MAVIATILLAIHLVAMNIASAAPLICIWLHFRGRRGDEAAWRAGHVLAGWSVAGLLLGVATGMGLGAVAWFDSSQEFADAIRRFPASAIANFAGELLFALVCLGIYVGTWERWRERPWLHGLMAVLPATNLLYHFPPLMAVINMLAVRPEMVAEPVISRAVFRPLMLRPEVLSQTIHFVVASVAVAGAGLVFVSWRLKQNQEVGADRAISAGAWIALVASLLQLAIGTWVVFELPPAVRSGLMGDAWPATGLFITAMVTTLGLLHTLATTALGDTDDANVRRSIVLMAAVVVLMATMLHLVRNGQRVGESPVATLQQVTHGS